MSTLIQLEHVSFDYGNVPALRDVSLHVRQGEIVTLLGPNGSGKSTLIKVMLGMLSPARGEVSYKGQNVAGLNARRLAREIAYVPQTHRSAFPYSVIDVVLMGRIPHKAFFFRYSKEDLEIAHDALGRLSLLHLAQRAYTEISGGERQLTIIARALAQGAKTLIMDEPAGGLDYGNQLRLLEQVSTLAAQGYTFVKSTHSPEHALWIADRAILVKQGRVVGDGPCKDVIDSESLFHLYNARVSVVSLDNSLRTCVPETIERYGGRMQATEDRANGGRHPS